MRKEEWSLATTFVTAVRTGSLLYVLKEVPKTQNHYQLTVKVQASEDPTSHSS